jgi:hypothetical protein
MYLSRISLWLGILGMGLSTTSCLNNSTDCVPTGNCNTVEPTSAQLRVNVTNDQENPAVPIAVYYGDVSDSVLYFRDTLTTGTTYDGVALNQKYAATAKYRRGNTTIIAIDGARTKLKRTKDCGDTCYEVTNAVMHLKLKN